MQTHLDIYETITASIIDAIETGCGAYEMPWNTFGFLPSNASTKRNHRGINVLVLWASAQKHSFTTQLWAT
jgi:antirestriction protein ArdC